MDITLNPIGLIHSVFSDPETGGRQAPIDGQEGIVHVKEEFSEGLEGLDEFSHVIAIYYFHRQVDVHLKAAPCFDKHCEHGIFASRYPARPNRIGISIWTLKHIEGNKLHCRDIDVLDGTPLLDIKPYVKQFDNMENPVCGWYDFVDWQTIREDVRSNQGHACK